MERFYGEKRDVYGRVEPNASVSVFVSGTQALATIYNASDPLVTPTVPKSNPFYTDANGEYSFAAPDGIYDITVQGAGAIDYKPKISLSVTATVNPPQAASQVTYLTGTVGSFLDSLQDPTNQAYGDALVAVKSPLTGSIATTQHEVNSRKMHVRDFGAIGDGATDDTAALEKAFQAVTNLCELEFSPNKIYLVSYIWAPNTDTDPSEPSIGTGRGRSIGSIKDKAFVTIKGNGATIKCVNHDIAANGGFRVLTTIRSPSVTVDGLRFDMSFTGYKDDASFYPMCGGIVAADALSGAGVQTALCSSLTVKNLRFKIYHPNGALAITSHPYGSDNNNGYKIISILAFGDTDPAATYEQQSRGLLMENIRFEKGHNGYGCWGYGYNDATFKNIHAEDWVASSFTIAGSVSTGVNYAAPVRFYQYYNQGLKIREVYVRSKPWSERSGAFVGACGGIHMDSGVNTIANGGAIVDDCEFILDNDDTTLGSVFDVGISSSLTGNTAISNCKFNAHTQAGVICIFLDGNVDSATGKASYLVSNSSTSEFINGPFIQIVNGGNTSAANRIIKSLIVKGDTVKGFGGEGAVYAYRTGLTYYGVENLIVSDSLFDGRLSISAGNAIDARTPTATDSQIIHHNVFLGYTSAYQHGSANHIFVDNILGGGTANSSDVNFLTNNPLTWQTFTAGQAVVITCAVGDYYEYTCIEYDGTGLIKFQKSGILNSGTGTIRTVGAGNTAQLSYKKIGNIK